MTWKPLTFFAVALAGWMNLLVIRSKDLATEYLENWQVHAKHSEARDGR